MDRISEQLKKMRIDYKSIEPMTGKDGVYLYRIICENCAYVLKYFENEAYRREIQYYDILTSLGLCTIRIIAATKSCLLMDDIVQSSTLRLGAESDVNDVIVVREIARWYKSLHDKGRAFVREHKGYLYSDNDLFTHENIEFIKRKTSTEKLPVWETLHSKFDLISSCIKDTDKTLTYNDFYYTNLVVAKDKSHAIMFDYNMLGKGYAYSDIRNVCYSMSADAKSAFLDEYGAFDGKEAFLDDVVSVIIGLYFACTKTEFPAWGNPILKTLHGDFEEKIGRLAR